MVEVFYVSFGKSSTNELMSKDFHKFKQIQQFDTTGHAIYIRWIVWQSMDFHTNFINIYDTFYVSNVFYILFATISSKIKMCIFTRKNGMDDDRHIKIVIACPLFSFFVFSSPANWNQLWQPEIIQSFVCMYYCTTNQNVTCTIRANWNHENASPTIHSRSWSQSRRQVKTES